MRLTRSLPRLLAAFVLTTSVAFAADAKTVAITPKDADEDFALQGEYVGEIEEDGSTVKIGVQVIALGDGKFRAVGYPGGLPGAGGKMDQKVSVEATRNGDEVRFETEDGPRGLLTADELVVERADRTEMGTLKKVHRQSKTQGAKPPKGAIVLFGGKEDAAKWNGGRVTDDGLLEQGATTKQEFGDGTLHVEFLLSYMPHARGQGRSNSGVYLQGRYEVQVLDSFGLEGKDNEAGGIYTVSDPKVNMCFPPLAWQTYDIDFTAPRFDADGKKTAQARMTVRHNGVLVQQDVEVPGPTRAAPGKEDDADGPVYIQNHGNPVRFRNVWFLPR